jgi:predicted Zn-dependent protease
MINKARLQGWWTAGARAAAVALIIGGALGASIQPVRAESTLDLPDLGDSSSRALTPEREKEYSEGLLRQLRNFDLAMEDAELNEYLETLAYRLVQGSGRSETTFSFALVDIPIVNAFASPGGLVVVFSGLLLATENESELAGVMAHEIAHVSQRHIARAMESSMEESLPILLGAIALAMAASGTSGDGAQAAMVGGMALIQQRQINFTRANEYEADRVGIQTLAKAGFDPIGMGDFFARIGAIYRTQGEEVPEFLRTHPVTAARVAEAKSRAEKLRTGTQLTSLDFMLMRERMRVLSSRDLPASVRYYVDNKKAGTAIDPRALRYGLALAQIRSGHYDEPRRALERLSEDDPTRLSYQLALGEVERGQRQFKAADGRYERLLRDRPGHRVISIAYARAQIEQDTAAAGTAAVAALRPLMTRFPNDPQLFELFGRANQLAGDEIRAAEAWAQAFFLRGKFEDAMTQLEQTAARNDLDYYQRARIDAQLALWSPVVLRERGKAEEEERRGG